MDLGPWGRKWAAPVFEVRDQLQRRWREATQMTRTTVQVTALILVVGIAYNYTFLTLIQNAGLETPLAYVSLVPLIALALAAVKSRPDRAEPQIHDRQVDYIVGVPLIATAMAINLFLPGKWSALFWVYRIDLLTLPVFVAGAVAIIFGVRVLWRQKVPVLFLFLGWSYLYESVLLRVLNAFTSATILGIRGILSVAHVAKPVSNLDNTLFVVSHNGHTFPLSIVSACSGVNSVVGFLLVGSAFAFSVRGPLLRKILWLASGMVLLWVINLLRITFIFWAGRMWGEGVALNILHPFVGLLTFSAGVAFMVLLIRPLGMQIGGLLPGTLPRHGTKSASGAEPTAPGRKHPLPVPKVYIAVALVLTAAIILGVSNFGLRSYNLVENASGEPKLASYISAPVAPSGWTSSLVASFQWAKPLFGDNSTWQRYYLIPGPGGNLHSNLDVVADVINTTNLASFSAYGVVQCYQFHGYSLADVSQVSLVGGIGGQSLSYTSRQYGSWSIVYWIVPVKSGTSTTYERVVLYIQNRNGSKLSIGGSSLRGVTNLAGSISGTSAVDRQLSENRTFLVAYARELIQDQAQHRTQANVGSSVGFTA
jgi:exosortase/archaeosortase family protein